MLPSSVGVGMPYIILRCVFVFYFLDRIRPPAPLHLVKGHAQNRHSEVFGDGRACRLVGAISAGSAEHIQSAEEVHTADAGCWSSRGDIGPAGPPRGRYDYYRGLHLV